MSNSLVFKLRLKALISSAERQLCDSAFQTEGALTLKALADSESDVLGTDSNSLLADCNTTKRNITYSFIENCQKATEQD